MFKSTRKSFLGFFEPGKDMNTLVILKVLIFSIGAVHE